jgi:hypothetical protein
MLGSHDNVKSVVFWDVTPCNFVDSSGKLTAIYEATWCHIQEDRNLNPTLQTVPQSLVVISLKRLWGSNVNQDHLKY